MKKPLILLSLAVISLCHPPTGHAACSEAAKKILDQAVVPFRNRQDLTQAQQALDQFELATKTDATCVDAFLKASHAAWWVADHATNREDKLKIFQHGMDLAKAALALDPKSIDARYWHAGNMGSYGEARGVLKSLFLVKPIRQELDEIIKLDPNYSEGAAYRVLGAVDYKVPGIAGGSKKRALERLTKALELGPNNGQNRYYMAEYYWTVGDKQKAIENLDLLKNLTADDNDRPDLLLMQEKGKLLETRLTGKSS